MTRIEIARHTAADPASVALLLAEPITSADETEPEPAAQLGPVRRNGVGFAVDLDVVDGRGGSARGLVTVVPAVDDGSDVRITLSPVAGAVAEYAAGWAMTFLESLAERARRRASAA